MNESTKNKIKDNCLQLQTINKQLEEFMMTDMMLLYLVVQNSLWVYGKITKKENLKQFITILMGKRKNI